MSQNVVVAHSPTGPRDGCRGKRGFVLITMAVAAIAVVAILGLAVDVGKMFISKNETQVYCDSAALGAALWLDGTTAGIDNAKTSVANSANPWNLDTTKITNPTVTFATSSAGPWDASPNPATGYNYVRVSATVSLNLYFIPIVANQYLADVVSSATAGQLPITSFGQGLAPYTAVATNNTGPNFGLVPGNSYDIQWPTYNGGGGGCDPTKANKIDSCFLSNPCPGDSFAAKQEVVNYWATSNSGYWGASASSVIRNEILDVIQLQPVSVGTNIQPVLTNGQKQAQSGYLDERASQDISTDFITNNDSQTLSQYGSPHPHNGRRLLPIPVVLPSSTTDTTVVGYGAFLLYSNGSTSDYYKKNTNGNEAFCAIYAGPYQVGGPGVGTGGTTGATYVKLVQ